MKSHNKPVIRAKLIFNPKSGTKGDSPLQLMSVIKEMQAWNFTTEPFLIEPECNLNQAIRDAISEGIRMFVACGGDGTISSVVKALLGTDGTLGIIPTGTQNNVANSLNIPCHISEAVTLLRTGQRLKVDVGIADCGASSMPFIESCSVGLFSSLLPPGEDIKNGKIARIGDFLKTLTTSSPSDITLVLDNNEEIQRSAHVVFITNMTYFGRHYEVGEPDSYHDGFLDVLLLADLSKLEVMDYVFTAAGASAFDDPRIQHFRVRNAVIKTDPPMSVMADGVIIGEGTVKIEVSQHALPVMVGWQTSDSLIKSGEINEK